MLIVFLLRISNKITSFFMTLATLDFSSPIYHLFTRYYHLHTSAIVSNLFAPMLLLQPGEYSVLSTAEGGNHNVTTVYGATDTLLVLHATSRLNELDSVSKKAWSTTIRAMLNSSTGWPELMPWELRALPGCMNPPWAKVPWHAFSQVAEALILLGGNNKTGTGTDWIALGPHAEIEPGLEHWHQLLNLWLASNMSILLGGSSNACPCHVFQNRATAHKYFCDICGSAASSYSLS